jgi:hypothetical protein
MNVLKRRLRAIGHFCQKQITMLLAVHTRHTDVRYWVVGVDLEALSKSVLQGLLNLCFANVHKSPVLKGACEQCAACQCCLSNSCDLHVHVHCTVLHCHCEAECALLQELKLQVLNHNAKLVMQCEEQNSK